MKQIKQFYKKIPQIKYKNQLSGYVIIRQIYVIVKVIIYYCKDKYVHTCPYRDKYVCQPYNNICKGLKIVLLYVLLNRKRCVTNK